MEELDPEELPKDGTKFVRMICCGKGAHFKCRDDVFSSKLSEKQKSKCPLCRQQHTPPVQCQGPKKKSSGFVTGLRKEKHGRSSC